MEMQLTSIRCPALIEEASSDQELPLLWKSFEGVLFAVMHD